MRKLERTMSVKHYFLSFLLAGFFLGIMGLFMSSVMAQEPAGTVETSEVEKGYASSYLPTREGPHVNKKYSFDKGLLADEERTLVERFDEARKRSLLGPGVEYIPLVEFLTDVGFDSTAEGWEGKCHQWSSAATDKNVKTLLNKTKGLICGGIVLEHQDLKELFTGVYPSKSESFYGSRARRPAEMDEEMYQMHIFLEGLLGFTDFSPDLFHEKAHSLLKKGQGFVLDMDAGEQVWNHPVYKIESTTKVFQGDLDPESGGVIGEKYLIPKNDDAKEALATSNEIDKVLMVIYKTADKKKDTALMPLLEKEGLKVPLIESLITGAGDKAELGEIIGQLVAKKFEVLEKASKAGVTIHPSYRVHLVETKVDYLIETTFRGEGVPDTSRTFFYTTIEQIADASGNPLPTPIKRPSQWISNFAFGGGSPDFLWVPQCRSETCHKEARAYRQGRYFQQMTRDQRKYYEEVGLVIGLSDLLKLFDKCLPLEKGIEMTEAFVASVKKIKEETLTEENKLLLKNQLAALRIKKVPYKLSAMNEILAAELPGVSIDPNGELLFISQPTVGD